LDEVPVPQARTTPSASQASCPISLGDGAIRVRDEVTFGLDGRDLCARFLSQVFGIPEIVSVKVNRVTRTATIRHDVGPAGLPGLLGRLATAIRRTPSPTTVGVLPPFPAASTFSIHRHGSTLSSWEVIVDDPGHLRLRHESLRGSVVLADRLERRFFGLPGIRIVQVSDSTGHLLIRYHSAVMVGRALIELAEATLRESEAHPCDTPAATPVHFGVANLSLGIAAAGEFLVPALLPLSALLLVGTNIRTFRAARLQLMKKRLGLPVLYIAIVATTLASGQFLASALMTWFFRFWHRRFRVELASERSRLLEHSRSDPIMARLLTPSGTEVLMTVGRLKAGDRLIVSSGEIVPADGRISGGEGVVDERGIRGLEGITGKRTLDTLFAGSTVLAGSFILEVDRVGEQTRSSSIRRALIAATSPAPGPSAPTIRSEKFASRAVGPTLAAAGVGLLAGDLMTVGAILRPDYATGPGMAVPLETLHIVALCARLGIVARDPESLERLAEVDLFVLEDLPILARTELELTRIETRLPEPLVLRYAASAFRHLVDDRATALLEVCRERQIHVLNLEAVDFGRGVTVVHGKHRVRVLEADPSSGPTGPLAVEIDGTIVGLLEFGPTSRLEAARVIDRIRRSSQVPFALVSSRPQGQLSDLASSLGVEMYRGNFRPEETADFLTACRGRGLKTGFVGDCRSQPRAAAEAHVAISLASDDDLDSDPAGLLMQQDRLAPLADLHSISRDHSNRVTQSQRLILVPNLLCVAGAFLFGFTGLTAVMLSNLGTLGLYRRASDSLRGLGSIESLRTGQPRRAG
jgi:cation transport ATPase